MSDQEFELILSDETKFIDGDIDWQADEDHSPAVEFRVDVTSDNGWPISVRGSYNPLAEALTFAIIHRPMGRIYALDMGKDHHNPACDLVGEKHKHCWTERFRDKQAYVPEDITAPPTRPVEAWQQFCAEAKIRHDGALKNPPAVQLDLDL